MSKERGVSAKPDWSIDGQDWPNREHSSFVTAGGLRWHVQQAGAGPSLLLLHGTGAATHSWRDLFTDLARDFSVIAPDLPAHGFTATPAPDGHSLPGMARGVAALLKTLGAAPDIVAGHSAGAAILARACLDRAIAPKALVSLNGAFVPFGGAAGKFFSPIAKVVARIPAVPSIFSWQAGHPAVIARLLRETGSTIDKKGAEFYVRLGRRPGHVAGAIMMMAQWDLAPLMRDLPRLATPLYLIVGGNDRTIPAKQAETIRALVPGSRVVTLPGLGHLAHEERPLAIAAEIRKIWAERAGAPA